MRCEQIRPWLNAYGDGTLPTYKAAWVSQHLAWCTECAAESARRARCRPEPATVTAVAARLSEPDVAASSPSGRPTGRWLRRTAVVSFVTAAAVFLASHFHLIR